MTLREIEQALQVRIDYLSKIDDRPWEEWLQCYTALAQVHQAIYLERIASHLEDGKIAILDAGKI